MAGDGELLGREAFREVFQGRGEPVFPVFGEAADICQETGEERSQAPPTTGETTEPDIQTSRASPASSLGSGRPLKPGNHKKG